jgi:hypothetical protein
MHLLRKESLFGEIYETNFITPPPTPPLQEEGKREGVNN